MSAQITQADREAASRAGLELSHLTERDAEALRQGGAWDEWSLVQSFAKHRTEADQALIELAYQYQSDLRHPPTADSVERRLERIAAVLAKVGGA